MAPITKLATYFHFIPPLYKSLIKIIAVSGLTEHCPIFHFPSSVRSFVRSSQA